VRDRPAAQMRHLVNRKLLAAFAVAVENSPYALLRMPEIQQREAVLAEQAGNVIATIRRDEPVVRLPADVPETLDLRRARIGEVDDPDLARGQQAHHEAVSRGLR